MSKKISSFMIWAKEKEYDEADVDPNYTTRDLYPKSDFYQAFRKWLGMLDEKDIPFHIDIHGKCNRKNERDINVGILSMYKEWPFEDEDSSFAKELHESAADGIDRVFRNVKGDFFRVRGNRAHELTGFWGTHIQSMTNQAINLGVPSFQLEFPRSVRKEMARNDRLLKNFARGLYTLYERVVCKCWRENNLYLNREPYLFDTVQNTYGDTTVSILDKLCKEYEIWEKYAKDRVI